MHAICITLHRKPVNDGHSKEENFILEVKDLCMHFPVQGGFFDKVRGVVKAVDGVSFNLYKGSTFGLVGESGCGKTTTGRLDYEGDETNPRKHYFP